MEEAFGEGTDLIRTTLTLLTLVSNVENLTYTGTGNFAGTGNSLGNGKQHNKNECQRGRLS